MKLFTKRLESCIFCPNFVENTLEQDDYDWNEPVENDYCRKTGKDIENAFEIPSWCPLPDAEEAKE